METLGITLIRSHWRILLSRVASDLQFRWIMTKVDHGQKQEHKNPSHYPVKETIMLEKSGEKCLNSAYILLVELPRFAKRPNVCFRQLQKLVTHSASLLQKVICKSPVSTFSSHTICSPSL